VVVVVVVVFLFVVAIIGLVVFESVVAIEEETCAGAAYSTGVEAAFELVVWMAASCATVSCFRLTKKIVGTMTRRRMKMTAEKGLVRFEAFVQTKTFETHRGGPRRVRAFC
jgi:hypothetical protein